MDIQGNCSRCSFTIPIEFIKFELKRFRETGGKILEEKKEENIERKKKLYIKTKTHTSKHKNIKKKIIIII